MLDDLRGLTLFVKTVELGSFKACAAYFNLSPSVVSYHLAQLEEKYATPLLYRSTRKITPTEQGLILFEDAKQMVAFADNALGTLNEGTASPRGKLNISLPAGLIGSTFDKATSAFMVDYPQIEFKITYTDQVLDLIENRIDLAIRTGALSDSSYKSLPLGHQTRTLVCAPSFLPSSALPTHPRDLAALHWIRLDMLPAKRVFNHEHHGQVEIDYKSTIQVNNVAAMLELTKQGLGLSSPPTYMVAEEIKAGRLLLLLPDWEIMPLPVQLLWHNQKTGNPLVRLFVDFIKQTFKTNKMP